MKTAQSKTASNMIVSDTAMARARASLAKVAFSSAQAKQIANAAQALPDVVVMAGSKRSASAHHTTQKLAATA